MQRQRPRPRFDCSMSLSSLLYVTDTVVLEARHSRGPGARCHLVIVTVGPTAAWTGARAGRKTQASREGAAGWWQEAKSNTSGV
jgi:hypothetical protein